MAKGYWVVRVDVRDQEAYKNYVAANGVPLAKFGARFLVRGGEFEVLSGSARQRNIVLEFPSYEAAVECWKSPEYQAAKAKQFGGADVDCIVIGGYEGPQPGA